MTVAAVVPLIEYVENGATLIFAVPFQFRASSELVVSNIDPDTEVETALVLSVDYTVTGGAGLTGSITKTAAAAAGQILRIKRFTVRSQTTDYITGGKFPAESHEALADKQVAIAQELDEDIDAVDRELQDAKSRAVLAPPGETLTPLADVAGRAEHYLAFDAAGNPVPGVTRAEVTDMRGDIDTNAGAIVSETAARIADVDQEEANRVAAVAGEAATRLAGDNSLSSLITTEEASRNAGDSAILALLASGGGIVGNASLNAATRAIMAALDSDLDLPAFLSEADRAGMFVLRDAVDYAAQIAADTEGGFYVPSTFDASKVWVRQAPKALFLEQFGGRPDGLLDNEPIFTVISAVFPDGFTMQMEGSGSVYAFDTLIVPRATRIRGPGRGDRDDFQAKILITGDGGGAADREVNGGVQWFDSLSEISGVAISYNNPALECLVNMSKSGVAAIGRNIFENFELTMESNITAANSIATALFLGNLIGTFPQKFRIRSPVGFKRDIVGRGFLNGCHLGEFALGPHAEDIAAGVFHTENPQIDIDASTQAFSIRKPTFEGGRNCIKAIGQGTLTIEGEPYMADVSQGILWLPLLAVAQGAFVCPSISGITADATAASVDLTNVSSTAALHKGMKLAVIGAGAAGAPLTNVRITAINGTTVTLDTAAETSVVGAEVYYITYAGHGYVATVAGNTGAAPPAWPVAAGGTVVDGTVTWREMGPCAWLNLNTVSGGPAQKDVVTLRGGIVFNNIAGICAISGAAVRPINVLNIGNVNFNGSMVAGHFDGVKSLVASAVSFGAYSHFGFNILNSTIFVTGSYNSAANTTANNKGADLVIGAGTTGTVNALLPPVGLAANVSMIRYNGGKRTRLAASTGNLTPTFDDDVIDYTLTANRTVNAPTGAAVESKEHTFRFKDNGANRNIAWNAIYRAIGVALPANTTANKLLIIRAIYNAVDVKWDVVSVQQEA